MSAWLGYKLTFAEINQESFLFEFFCDFRTAWDQSLDSVAKMNDRIADLVTSTSHGPNGNDVSRATSPGMGWREVNGTSNEHDDSKDSRYRPRTFPYLKYLPYEVETHAERQRNLDICIKRLYIAVSAGDFAPGAVHWTRELRGWLSLKFDLPRETRVKLVKLYYELALAPGIDYLVAERFASMFMVLIKYALGRWIVIIFADHCTGENII